MMTEVPFASAEAASTSLGSRYAKHIARNGATMIGYTQEQEKRLTELFRKKMQETWNRTNRIPLTADQLDSLEDSFNRTFGATLGTLTGI